MARKSEVERAREHLKIAADLVRPAQPEVAETLEALRKPFGHRMLVQDRNAPRVPGESFTNVAIEIPEHLRKEIQDAALDAAPSDDAKVQKLLGAVLAAGIPKVMSGEVAVREIPRLPRDSGVKRVNLNVPIETNMLEQLRQELPALGPRLGFKAAATVPKIAVRLLLDEYGLDYEPIAMSPLAQIQLYVPPRLAEAIREKLPVVDADLRSLIEEGFQKVLAGTWKPYEIPKAAQGSEYERTILPARVDRVLVEQVRDKARELKQELGHRVTAPTIAIDYLISELGLEDLADAEYGSR